MISEILQTIGLLSDIIGAIIIANFLRKTKFVESSPFGIPTNTAELLTDIVNTPIKGTYFLIIGFSLQLIAVWI